MIRRTNRRWAVAAILALATIAARRADCQNNVIVVTEEIELPDGTVQTVQRMVAQPGASGETPQPGSAGAATPSPRIDRLRQLQYDRRPSTILREWAAPEPAEPDIRPPAPPVASPLAEAAPAAAAPGSSEAASAAAPEKPTATAVAPSAPPSLSTPPGAAPSVKIAISGRSAAVNPFATPSGLSGLSGAPAMVAPAAATEPAPAPAASAPSEAAAAQPAIDPAVLEYEFRMLQRNVTLGRWDKVKAYFKEIPLEDAKAGYAQLLQSLMIGPQDPNNQQRRDGVPIEQNLFELSDLLAIASASPVPLDRPTTQQLAYLSQLMFQSGLLPETLIERLQAEAARPKEEQVLTTRQCAWLLASSGQARHLEKFLPAYETLLKDKDAEGLILFSQCQSALFETDGKPETLERAFSSAQPVLELKEAKPEQQDEAMRMVLALIPRVRKDLGHEWLRTTFAGDPQFGMKVLAGLGAATATGLPTLPFDSHQRLQNLRIQKSVVESLLEKQPQRVAEWQETIRLLAQSWLKEGELSHTMDQSTSYGPRMQRDMYGNFFYLNGDDDGRNMMMYQQHQGARPIASADVIDVAPNDAWLATVDDDLRPKFLALQAQLLLKVQEEERAFPLIEQLAKSYPDLGRDLTNEFLRVWTRNHDPNANSQSRYTNPYMYMYGFEQRASGIPLTRSKQERNLKELAAWIPRIRALPVTKIDESLFASAFTTCHSSAEVYRLDSIEAVFGPVGSIEPNTLAQLVQQMRENLQSAWRLPAQQEQAKTQRKQKDIEAEVVRGYGVARSVIDGGVAKNPDNWRLALVQACLSLDELSYHNEIQPSSEFSDRRRAAIDQFRHAADLYARQVATLSEAEQSAEVFEHWYYAGLGASDLNQIDHRSTPDPRQPALIREAILALPGESAEKHMGKFANSLFTRMSGLKPAVKYTYLKAGFEIVGDAKQAVEARKVYDYYKDLVSEIKLVTRIDGTARVGHDDAFGVFVDLVHTPEIERESGGFGKYLQNQNSMSYAYNYGRPLENYRDKFEESVRAALVEQFDVQSVTFQEKDVHARSTSEPGWRVTPYAYVLLKPRGPQVDKLPSFKMDLDFLDTSGYAVLPIVSSPLPMDAAVDRPDPRPYAKLNLTQTLDERQAAEGKLILEIKAAAQGLVPELEELVDVRTSDFEVTSTDDEGVAVAKFDSESTEPAVISERTWMITYQGRKDLAALPTTFAFPAPKVATQESNLFRYEDADLKSVEPVVALVQKYGDTRSRWPWFVAGGGLVALSGLLLARAIRRRRAAAPAAVETMPEKLTPFTVLALLKKIEDNNGFDFQTKEELDTAIRSLERHYFAEANGENHVDLKAVAERWLAGSGRARRG